MDDYLRRLCDENGYVTRNDLHRVGYLDRALYRSVRRGDLVRLRHGAYTLPDIWEGLDPAGRHLVRARAVVGNARSPVALSHASALVTLGTPFWGVPLDDVHVTRLDEKSGRREAGVAQHRGTVRVDDLSRWSGSWVTSPTRTALDLTTIVGTQAALVAIDGLLAARLTTVESVAAASRASPNRPHTLTTDLVLRLVDGRSESVGESRTRYLCWTQGLPAPVLQYEVREGGIVLARLDLAWPQLRVWAEFDGQGKYTSSRRPGESIEDVVLREKTREDLVRRLTGWSCIRICWADLERPGWLAHVIRRAFDDQAAA